MNLTYKEIFKSESAGRYGAFGIQILVASPKIPDIDSLPIWSAARGAADSIEAAIMGDVLSSDPECLKAAQIERDELTGAFAGPIFIEEIPNGYCPRWCCRHLPWFVVTTTVGRFKIGWRKRVINIEWNETRGTKTAEELFPTESVTKGERMIHAWGAQDAKRYVEAIIASAESK